MVTTATLMGPVPAQAMDAAKPVDSHKKWTPPHTALPRAIPVHTTKAPGPSAVKTHYKVPGNWAGPVAAAPAPEGTAPLTLTAQVDAASKQAPRAGKLPVWVTPADGGRKQAASDRQAETAQPAKAGTALTVGVLDAATAHSIGAQGPVVTVDRGGAGPAGRIEVGLDVRQLDASFGADASSRSRLVALPACALTTPAAPDCRQQTLLPSRFDSATGRLVAAVTLPAAAPAPASAEKSAAVDTQPLVLAATTTSGGGGGTYTASSLSPSAAWEAGSSSGGFTYSYPIQVPTPMGGDAPKIALSYDSSAVDGRTSSTNSQASWIGDGWDYSPGFVERTYKSCDQDGLKYSGDSCWGGYNATLSLPGHSSELVRDDTSGTWRLKNDDGSKVEFLTGADNGTSTGEYIKVSTTSGSTYYFGLNHLPGGDKSDPAANSAWTKPVYSPKSGDACYDAAKGDASWCQMGWRWNLDYAVDPHGNLTTYSYTAESNYYARGGGQNQGTGTQTSYTRGGALASIAYGQLLSDQVTAKGKLNPAAKVLFNAAAEGRCSTAGSFTCTGATLSASNAAHWPDVPYDQNCTSTGTCTNYAPNFWSNIRLASISTQVLSNGAYKNVDTYALTHTYPDPADSNKPTMWLAGIQRTGQDGTPAITLPQVSFTAAELPNRVDGTSLVPAPTIFNRPRIQTITTETGEQIQVDYNLPACSRVNKVMPASADTDTLACYNVKWYPPGSIYGADPASDWFNRYTVASVTENDPVAHTTSKVTKYQYGAAAWHYGTSEVIDPKTRTWDEFRGFASVTTATGNGQDGPVTQAVTKYLQGMDGDTLPGGGTRSVKVADSLGEQVTDSDWLSGRTLESDTYNKAGGSLTAYSVTTATDPATTATHVRGSGLPDLVARYNATTAVATSKALKADGTWRATVTTTRTDAAHANRTTSVDVAADGQPEQCTLTSYADSSNALMTGMADEVKTLSGSGACTATPTAANTVKDTRTLFDGQPFGKSGTQGDATSGQVLDHYDGSGTPVFTTTGVNTYDGYGRITSVTDPNTTDTQHPGGATTSTVYTPAKSGELPATVTVTKPAPGSSTDWTSTTTMDVGRNQVLASTDLNGKTTTKRYDALGRVTAVWAPGRTTSQNANATFTYAVNGSTGPSTVTSGVLRNDDGYKQSFALFDGFGRQRQTQATPGLSAFTGRLITDTYYDSHGWPVETRSPYYDDATAPGTSLVTTTDNQTPGRTSTVYDGQGRPTASVFSSYAAEQWRTTTAYPGVDETDVTPPQGGTPTTAITDALGHTSERWQYKTPTATGHASDADVTAYTYTPDGKPATHTDATGQNRWSYTYDLIGRQTSTTDPDTGTTTLTYDRDGRLATSTDARKQTLSYDYDLIGRKTAEYSTTSPSTTPVPLAAWSYDSVSSAKGQPVKASRFVNGKTDAPYTSEITGYDNGYRATATTVTIPASEGKLAGTYTSTATYDPVTGEVTESSTGARGDIPAETLDYSYDVYGPLGSFGSSATTYDVSTDYDAFGRAVRTTANPWGTQIVATDNYDQATGNLLSSWIDKQTAANGAVQQTSYSRNPAGQLTAIQNIPDNAPAQTDLQCFSYDYLGRLTTAWTDTGATSAKAQPSVPNIGGCKNTTPTSGAAAGKTTVGGPAAYWSSYAYDTTGNRTGLTQHDPSGDTTKDVTTTPAFAPAGQANQPTTAANTGGGTGGAHALLSTTSSGPGNPGSSAYQYDATGNTTAITTTAGTTSLTWDAEDKLATVASTGSSGTTSYVYDTSGNQLVRRDPGKTTLTIGTDELTLDTNTNQVTDTRTYALPNGLSAVRTGSAITWQSSDNHGTAALSLDSKTLAETRRPTDPFGSPRGTQPTSWAGDHGFVGGTQDPATGLTNLGAREYQPSTGRFINPDPILDQAQPQQWNGYAYSNNNPVNLSDPTGLCPRDLCGDGYLIGGDGSRGYTGERPGDVECKSCNDRLGSIGSGPVRDDSSSDDTSSKSTCYYAMGMNMCSDGGAPAAADATRDTTNTYNPRGNPGGYPVGDPSQNGPCTTACKVALGGTAVIGCALLWEACLTGMADLAAGGTASIELQAAGTGAATIGAGDTAWNLFKGGSEAGEGKTAGSLGNCFLAGTQVLMADKSTKNIEQIKVGEEVLATDPTTGRASRNKVTALIVTEGDKHLNELTITTKDGPKKLTATSQHPFWVPAEQRWVLAADLKPGTALLTDQGATVTLQANRAFSKRTRTYNLTVADVHTYYVLAGATPVLVHNSNCPDVTVFHYTDKKGFNGIRSQSPYRIDPGDSKNGAGPFFTTKSPDDLTAPSAFKKLGITNAKSQFVMQFTVPRSSLVPLRGDRGQFIFTIPQGVTIPRPNAPYFGPTNGWSGQ
ncbi:MULTISPECIES: polymorphic toxin-type HINT domain-containing protein [unclassified Streptomyces]|uniref:polymorphic toxin-type HINT domain-containing protein n=1 Tax=unclassified Streptomyces TaxID=2593676 RepID=UPI003816B736